MILWPWHMSLINNRHLPLIVVINCTMLYDRGAFWFSLYPAYNVSCHVFLLCDNTTLTFNHRLWKTIRIFLSSCWSIVPSCMIVEQMVQYVSSLKFILPRFPTMWKFNLDLWPTILNNKMRLPRIMVINCTELYDPGAYRSLYPDYNVFVQYDSTTVTFDQRPWKRIGIFLS